MSDLRTGESGAPVGVILAGGHGRRIGGSKAIVALGGRPLISYPLAAMAAVLPDVAVLAKPRTELPDLPGVEVWVEPPTPVHPMFAIIHALALAGGRSVVVCAVDLPFVTPAAVAKLVRAPAAAAVLAAADGQLQPLLARYGPAAAPVLARALEQAPEQPLRLAVQRLQPVQVELDPRELFNVNSREDILRAAAILDDRGV